MKLPPVVSGLIFLVAAGVIATAGCSTRPAVVNTTDAKKESEDPWPRVALQIRKEPDGAGCRRVLGQLKNDLSVAADAKYQPEGLSAAAEPVVRKLLSLDDDSLRAYAKRSNATDAELRRLAEMNENDVREIRQPAYTNLDPNYLTECLFLRDVVRSLDVEGLPPARQAGIVFAWVCRQVVLSPWVTTLQTREGSQTVEKTLSNPPVPVTQILRRGSGSSLERAYVFLAALQQLNLDACLIGGPEAGDTAWRVENDPRAPRPADPFWAVGVRVGADVLLFAPGRGESVPGPNGQGIATFAQLKGNPDLLKPWLEDKVRPWNIPPAAIKDATPYLTVPLSAAAPRWNRFEREMAADNPVRLAIDPVGLRQRFADESKLGDVRFWNPVGDLFGYTRVLESYLPVDQGGTGIGANVFRAYEESTLPADLLATARNGIAPPSIAPLIPDLLPKSELDLGAPEIIRLIGGRAIAVFVASFVVPPYPREQIERGQFFDVTPRLVQKRKLFTAAQERVRTDRNQEQVIREWAKKVKDLSVAASVARDKEKTDPAGYLNAQQNMVAFMKQEGGPIDALIDVAMCDAGAAESTYLLALCVHEQAERAQIRYERIVDDATHKDAADAARAKAAEAWTEAKGWWVRYEPFAAEQSKRFPGRGSHAHALAERATHLADQLSHR
ncbi:hypothetical protein [Fimbriiglobus ruber]|uniref:Transglutaminase-like domain-containing protein n=1 Tax=Fimbriiglobus ruber TaxID=1908690 RepID=A0A225DZZ5_9BACT|nr:hypothetical protein [Fimbriiglobus ruber]OWK47080.1 hypothetical protein FRUB_00779 [Fimbriiglobus ruber]